MNKDPFSFVMSANVLRRHLTTDQKKAIIVKRKHEGFYKHGGDRTEEQRDNRPFAKKILWNQMPKF